MRAPTERSLRELFHSDRVKAMARELLRLQGSNKPDGPVAQKIFATRSELERQLPAPESLNQLGFRLSKPITWGSWERQTWHSAQQQLIEQASKAHGVHSPPSEAACGLNACVLRETHPALLQHTGA